MGSRRSATRLFLASTRVHMVPQWMVHQSSFLALAIHDSGMGGTVSRLSRLVKALASLRFGLEHLHFGFTHSGGFTFSLSCRLTPPSRADAPLSSARFRCV